MKVLVVGLGRSGLAAANLLVSQGAKVKVTDQKSAEQLGAFRSGLSSDVTTRLGEHNEIDFREADLIVISPGVPATLTHLEIARKRKTPIWSEVELAFRFMQGLVVGVTGSNGKTTTTTLIGEIFRRADLPVQVGGNIGVPLTSLVHDPPRQKYWVVELSSFQLENIVDFRCDIAVLLNITPDHLNRHRGFDEYRQLKLRIFQNQTEEDVAVINADDPESWTARKGIRAKIFPFSRNSQLKTGAWIQDSKIRVNTEYGGADILPVQRLGIRGSHNIENALAAAAVASIAKIPPRIIAGSLEKFIGVEHRLELVRNLDGVDYYNDSKATNVASAIKAIEAFEQPLIIIMGGQSKDSDFKPLRKVVKKRASHLLLIGEEASKLQSLMADIVPCLRVESMSDAVRQAHQIARPGNVVLLSPACASFDMFRNFEHRGQSFKKAVSELKGTL